MAKKVIFCLPTVTRPYQVCLDSLAASIPLIHDAGWEEGMANSIGCPYISRARATMLRKAQDARADVIVFIDHDMSWRPQDLLKLIETDGDVVAGTYRFKTEPEEYMGSLFPGIDTREGVPQDGVLRPQVRADGAVLAHCVPAGFLKITRQALAKFMFHYPELQYVEEGTLTVDLFNHGVHKGVWWGEDYAFSRNWNEKCGQIWIIPDLNLDHHGSDGTVYPGNYHQFLLRQVSGSNHEDDASEARLPRLRAA